MKKAFLFLSLILAGSLSNHSAWAVPVDPGEGGGTGGGDETPPDDTPPDEDPPTEGGDVPPPGGGGDEPPTDDAPTEGASTAAEELKAAIKSMLEKWRAQPTEGHPDDDVMLDKSNAPKKQRP